MTKNIVVLGIACCVSAMFSTRVYAQDISSGVKTTAAGVALDVQDADLRIVIAALAEAGGLNVVYNDLPQKTVTLRLNQPITKNEVRSFMRSMVESAGLLFQDEGSMIRIAVPPPEREAVAQVPHTAQAGGGPGSVQLFVYRLKHAPANRLAATLQSLFGIAGSEPAQNSGHSSLSQELRSHQVPPGLPQSQTERSTPNTVAVIGAKVQGDVHIVADELTNSLLVRASLNDWQVISNAIEALDLRPLQVLIEVLIAEVRRSSLLDVGVSATTGMRREPRTGADLGGELSGPTAGDVVLRILNLGRLDADILISSMYSRSDVTVLSRPVILAQNNQDARIMIGSERPFVQVFRSLPTDAGVRDQVVQYRDVGTSLKIRPTINYDGYVSLDLLQEVSTATNEVQFGAPVISTREASTRLLVKNEQTAVIGGLIDRQQDRTRGGIPLLRDIPILGRLFGSSRDNHIQTELFLFITPHIISDDEDANRIREEIEQNTEILRKHLPKNRVIVRPDPSGVTPRSEEKPAE